MTAIGFIPTSTALPDGAVLSVNRVLRRELMSADAMRLSSVLVLPSSQVLLTQNWFQMFRSAAASVTAQMVKVVTGRDGANPSLVCETMGVHHLAIRSPRRNQVELPVAIGLDGSGPRPAVRGLVYESKEPFKWGFGDRSHTPDVTSTVRHFQGFETLLTPRQITARYKKDGTPRAWYRRQIRSR